MRVGISTSVVQRGRTGVGQYLLALTQALCAGEEGHEFVLFVLEQDEPLFAFARGRMRIVPVPEKFRPPVRNILWHQTVLPRLAREHRIDVLHVPSYRRLLWPRPCALVATVHDLGPFRVAGKYDPGRMFYGRVVARRLARRQDAIIAISRTTARDLLRHWGVSGDRLTVIHNGLDHGRYHPGPAEPGRAALAERHGVRGPFLLYVARLEHPGKNHVRLITAFERFKTATGSNWQLVFAGSDWSGAEAIHRRIRQSPFAREIRCLGFVPDADLPAFYRAAAAFVYPSLYEGFGMPPLEAMACGCPVISSTGGALAEVVGDGALTVEPEDTAGWTAQLMRLAEDGAVRNRLRQAGLARAREFDWRRNAAATLQVYARAQAGFWVPGSEFRVPGSAVYRWQAGQK